MSNVYLVPRQVLLKTDGFLTQVAFITGFTVLWNILNYMYMYNANVQYNIVGVYLHIVHVHCILQL